MKKTVYVLALLAMVSCQKENIEPTNNSAQVLSTAVVPVVISGQNAGGNVTCDEAATYNGIEGYAFSTGKQDYPFTSSSFGDNVIVETDGTNVSWSIIAPEGYCVSNVAVIVKGGPSANVYFYEGQSSDSGLTSPVNASGSAAGLSNLTICYNLVACQSCNWTEETAYAGGTAGSGNAWWYALDAAQSGTYPIYAGQVAVDGASVTYNASTDVITINLGSNAQLQNVSEPVKVEGYNVLPTSRPASGLFQLYKGSDLTVQGNGSAFYVVHLDVEVCK